MNSTKSTLLYHQEEDDENYFSSQPSYKRSNLQTTIRQKCKGFRSRSSSYTSIDENKSNTTNFSRKKLGMTGQRAFTTPVSYPEPEDESDEYSDENTFFAKQSNYARQNVKATSSSWKSCVLRAVGVRSSK
ncbi:hypothetical protein INT48_006139 [Thamnidium elegans]|uniref:Uncharacterized protein n=1 Tax=Thamnidium elegans TaxID=101142 RepID=A0A8H7W153_9FUNG|nr:hypothetical protein INT48_006139 [Thamnidium elegans]